MEHCMVDGCHATCADLAALRHHERTAHGAVGDDWLPTAENVNALPDPLRRYIHDLETRADPSGDLRDKAIAQDEVAMLRAALNANVLKLSELRDQLRQRDEIIDTEHQQTEHQRQRAIDAEYRLGEAQEMVDAHLESRNDALAQLAQLVVDKSTLESRLGSCEQALADIRHAWEHANEIGRMDHYAANTIKQALSSGTAPARHADGSAKAAPSQWWCPTHGGLIDKGQPCLDGCVESDFAVERQEKNS